ncbi:MAG: hypothetical protein SPK73_02195, partial [Eubacteriales bacterium]|nr:hypothetical protein [Eubacteriales bacterium]
LNDNARMAAFRAGQAAYQSSRANSIAGQQGNNVRPQAKAEYEAGVNREYSDRKLTSSQRKQIYLPKCMRRLWVYMRAGI